MANQSKHYSQASVATPMNPSTPTPMADCEGDAISSPPVSAQRYETAVNASSNAYMEHEGRAGMNTEFNSTRMTTDENELSMPTRINLNESGLRRSARIRELKETEAKTNVATKAHVTFGAKATKTVLGLFTLFSFVSSISIPNHQVRSNETFTDTIVRRFEEVNEHYDNTLNQMHFLSYVTDISSNEVFTFHKAMKEADKMDFVEAMEKEVLAHESRNHWTVVNRSSLPSGAKPIKAIWSFKRKRRPDGTLLKHKARLCAHGGMQQWGDNGNLLSSCQHDERQIAPIHCQDLQPRFQSHRFCLSLSTSRFRCGYLDVPTNWFPNRWPN